MSSDNLRWSKAINCGLRHTSPTHPTPHSFTQCLQAHTHTHTCTAKAHVHIPGQKQHTSLSENLWMEKWFKTLGGAANFLRFFLKGLEELIVCRSVCQSAGNVFVYGPYQSVSLFACMSVCLAVFLCLSACLPVRQFLFVYLSAWASACLSASPLLFCLTLYLPACLSVCLTARLMFEPICHYIQLSWTVSVLFLGKKDRQLHLLPKSRHTSASMICLLEPRLRAIFIIG